METGWRSSTVGGHTAGQNTAWNVWDINTTYNWTNSTEASVAHALLFGATITTGVESNSIHRRLPDPHMMCLKLGKRHYCDDTTDQSSATVKRSGKPPYPVPRCQVDGCHVALGSVKEYYRKHKVCEVHSKAPKVVVLGLQQRFCQQCSRFHGVTEFDESKRSCRRRLKGHNQRRRKGAISTERRPSPSQSNPGCALSLLSSPKTEPWNSLGDMSSRCSAALYELIAAKRATGHFLNQNAQYRQSVSGNANALPDTQLWDRFGQTTKMMTTTTDLKQGSALEFGLLSMKDPEEWTDYCWSSFGGSGVV